MSGVLPWSLHPYHPQAARGHLKILPKVARPTGTAMGPCKPTAGSPRLRPSVPSIATQRMVPSPRSCCTSHVTPCTWMAWDTVTSTALVSSAAARSTTGPIICDIFPHLILSSKRGSTPQFRGIPLLKIRKAKTDQIRKINFWGPKWSDCYPNR